MKKQCNYETVVWGFYTFYWGRTVDKKALGRDGSEKDSR